MGEFFCRMGQKMIKDYKKVKSWFFEECFVKRSKKKIERRRNYLK